MRDDVLAPRWRYDLGHRKIFELRSALGLQADGPAPSSAVFAYAVVPGLARILTHPQVATSRRDLRLSRIETVFASELDMSGELACTSEVKLGPDVVAVISCADGAGAKAVVTVHLSPDSTYEAPAPLEGTSPLDALGVDPARCMAFAAATWDLNPAYWDQALAESVGLGGPVAPPGLPFALAAEALERHWGRRSSAWDVRFDRAARPGDVLQLRATSGSDDVRFEVVSEDGVVLHGETVLGHPGGGL